MSVSGVEVFSWTPPQIEQGVAPRNFGDEIGPAVVRALLERSGVDPEREESGRRLLAVGSVLHFSQRGDVVWGSGINGKVRRQRFATTLDVRAVRGPLTRAALLAHGVPTPAVFGDPALLVGDLFPDLAAVEQSSRVVVVPNLNDLSSWDRPDVISPLGEPFKVIHAIASAGFVVASSLHALIVADALGVPSRPLRSLAEHPFKYVDYYAGTGRHGVRFAHSVEEAVDLGPVAPLEFDREPLLTAFPFDLWGELRTDQPPAPRTLSELRSDGDAQRERIVLDLDLDLGPEPPSDEARAILRLDQLMAAKPHGDGLSREDAKRLGIAPPHLRSLLQDTHQLSVVVPTHDVGPWIRETLRSLLTQDVDDMEVIVVDDHSQDSTCDIVAGIAEGDPRVRLIRASSRGGGSARNIGVDHARGRYIVFCDGDDIVPAGAYRELVESLEASGSDIAFGDYLKFRPSDTWSPTASMSAYRRRAERIRIATEPTLILSRPCWNKVFLRRFWESSGIRFPDVPRSNDIVPMLRAYLLAERVDIVPRVVYMYRERPGRSSMSARAVSSSSMVSYFEQERQCAALIRSTHNLGLQRTYAALVHDRDAYVHVRRFLELRNGPSVDEDAVVRALRALLATAPPAGTSASWLRRTVMRLAASGRLDEAARLASAEALLEPTRMQFADWAGVFSALREIDPDPDLQEVRLLAAAVLSVPAGAVDAEKWLGVRDAIEAAFPGHGLNLAPSGAAPASSVAQLLRNRTASDVRLHGIDPEPGGRGVILAGSTLASASDLLPVFHDPHHPDAPIRPRRVSWEQQPDGRWRWSASFATRAFSMHQTVVPAFLSVADGGLDTSIGDVRLPAYRPTDAFLYERGAGLILLRRRHHWLLRAGRRAARSARARFRR